MKPTVMSIKYMFWGDRGAMFFDKADELHFSVLHCIVSSNDSLSTSIYSMTLPACPRDLYESEKNEVASYFDEFMKGDINAVQVQDNPEKPAVNTDQVNGI